MMNLLDRIQEKRHQVVPKEIAKLIREELRKEGITPVEVGIFGSRATSEARPTSDWDFYAWIDPSLWEELKRTSTEIPELSKLMKIQNSICISVSPEHPYGIRCTFGPDFSRCVDFKLTPRRPLTGRSLR